MSKTGQVLQSEIVGSVKMRVRLTGMPELRLGLNDKVLFESTGSEFHVIEPSVMYIFVTPVKMKHLICISIEISD